MTWIPDTFWVSQALLDFELLIMSNATLLVWMDPVRATLCDCYCRTDIEDFEHNSMTWYRQVRVYDLSIRGIRVRTTFQDPHRWAGRPQPVPVVQGQGRPI